MFSTLLEAKLQNPEDGALHVGLAFAQLEVESLDLGHGLSIRQTFAHLIKQPVIAFAPAPPGGHHPAPWRPVFGGTGFDIQVEVAVPAGFRHGSIGAKVDVAWLLTALLRLRATARLSAPLISDFSYSFGSEQAANYWPVESESEPGRLLLDPDAPTTITEQAAHWVRDHWPAAALLRRANKRVEIALDAFDQSSFERNPMLAFLSLWSALEALYSPGSAELRFRISANASAFLARPEKRPDLQREIAALYDVRSKLVHGARPDITEPLFRTYAILRDSLQRAIEMGSMPTAEELTRELLDPGVLVRSPP